MKKDALDNAWKIHDATGEWTARVDAKAAFAFTVESAVLGVVVALTTTDKVYDGFDSWWSTALYVLGVFLIFISIYFAGSVVVPQLNIRGLEKASKDNYIFFGHTRFWEGRADELAERLKSDDLLKQVSLQIGIMGRIAWDKHIKVQRSMWFAMTGLVVFVVLGVLMNV
ncbi:hypothetical protein E3T55_19760 [Cryobacterium frigoriphilum]|uniref:Pycsar effector protein domain-containing protein n=1 Tax=Cryobacterium frigoriphilum TaxID=1259150 RepID=A0A4R8ZT61_9MICO|nr:Pycsar system effector family protein [Cryobacterium frigoriphilum]TFD44802.1 hypothetical protein E3T55_19760 [Cryobacterium frigoriphilum]